MRSRNSLTIVFSLALIIRLLLVAHPGFKADIAYWKWWGKSAVEQGLVDTVKYTGLNYPPVYLYFLQATSWVYSKFAPLDGNYWDAFNFLYLLLIKLPYIAADLGIGWLIYLILGRTIDDRKWKMDVENRRPKLETSQTHSRPSTIKTLLSILYHQPSSVAIFASAIFLFNPAVIYNSVIWGQTDSLSSFFILLMYYSLLLNRYSLFSILTVTNVFLKVQSLPFIVLALVIIVKREGLGKAFSSLIPAVVTMAVINLPYILKASFSAPIAVMVNALGYFPYVSLNAYNLHWLLIRGTSDKFPDSTRFLSLISYKTLGMSLFIGVFLTLVIYLWKNTRRNSQFSILNSQFLFFSSLLAIFGSYLFMTEIHERYLFPVYMFGALLVPLVFASSKTSFLKKFTQPAPRNLIRGKSAPVADEYVDIAEALSSSHKERSANIGSEKSGVERSLVLLSLYLLLSLSGLINLHLVMIQNYPENNLRVLNFMLTNRIPISLVLSVLNLAVFTILFLPILKEVVLSVVLRLRLTLLLLPLCLFLVLYLSLKSLSPASVLPLTSLTPSYSSQQWGQLTRNQTVAGNLLAPAYYFHRNGLGTHANSQIDYNLNGRFSRFTTGFGTDIEAADNASTEFLVILDGQLVFKSDIMRKSTPPGYVDLPVQGVKKLSLIVTDARDGINSDHADWLEPTLYK